MEAKEFWIERNEGERVRVAINEFKEKMYLDLRVHYQAEDGEWKPTKKGVSFDAEKLDELQEILSKLKG